MIVSSFLLECNDGSKAMVFVVLGAIVFSIAVMIVLSRSLDLAQATVLFKILMSFMQVMATCDQAYNFPWHVDL